MWRTVLGVYLVAGVVIALVNAAYMLLSPRAWFRLPRLMRLNGSLTEERYSRGWGAVQVRLLGAILLAVFAWLAFRAIPR